VRIARQVEEHLAPADLAERVGVSLATVRRAVRSREIFPVVRIGRLVRIPATAANKWLGRCKG
jgi:excisionase family DNA binding protein